MVPGDKRGDPAPEAVGDIRVVVLHHMEYHIVVAWVAVVAMTSPVPRPHMEFDITEYRPIRI